MDLLSVTQSLLEQNEKLSSAVALAEQSVREERGSTLVEAVERFEAIATMMRGELRALEQLVPRAQGTERRLRALDAHIDNLGRSLGRAAERAAQGDWVGTADRVALEVLPMFDGLRNRLEREKTLAGGIEEERRWRDSLVSALRAGRDQVDSRKHEFEVSIVLCAYNKLEYTQLAVESLLEHTDLTNTSVEILLVDNGSTDGTRDYFRGIPGARVVELDVNTGPLGGFAAGWCASRGRFIAWLANDVVVTPRWLEQLLTCVRSDPEIALVVPTCNAISNLQAVPTDYGDDFAAMNRFADRYNSSNPRKWEERARLMPFAAVMPRSLLEHGFRFDPIYSLGEFVDDDESTVFRRAGYRQVLAGDTFVHHFGSVTLGEAQRAESSLQRMRSVYRDKWGVDAWDGCSVLLDVVDGVGQLLPRAGGAMLMVEPLFGDTFLRIRRALADAERELQTAHALVLDERFLPDAQFYFDAVHGALNGISTQRYDLIALGREVTDIAGDAPSAFLESLAAALAPGGRLFARVRNPHSVRTILSLLQPRLGYDEPSEKDSVTLVSLPEVERRLRAAGLVTRLATAPSYQNEATERKLAELFMKLVPGTTTDHDTWLSPTLVLIVERPSRDESDGPVR
jgi:GT2 family glycosyltransferase